MSNPPTLIENEQEICSSLGMFSSKHLSYLRYYEKTGRVSSHWEAAVASLKDVARWSLLAPPNDIRKAKLLANWVAEKLQEIFRELSEFDFPTEEDEPGVDT
ncbi:MAG: hypothetical protein P1Q69_13285 [Candidatus Thorarchaeota archaeon]|nr:hypothetical protein [Candidatus Thorarchaeota archaeon]